MPTTWNPSDLVSETLSNGNLTAVTSAAGGVRSIFSASAGKWYWEATFGGASAPGIGFANSSAALGTVWATPTNAAIAKNGSIYVNNVLQSGGVSIATSSTICVALDLVNQRVWWRNGAAGQWNGSGTANPATNVGGISLSVLGTPLFALVASNATGSTWTANFGASAFVGAVPSGFNVSFGPFPLQGIITARSLAQASATTTSASLSLEGAIATQSAARSAAFLAARISGKISARSAASAWMPTPPISVFGRIKTQSNARLLQQNAILVASRMTTQSKARGVVYLTAGGFRAQWGVTVNSG